MLRLVHARWTDVTQRDSTIEFVHSILRNRYYKILPDKMWTESVEDLLTAHKKFFDDLKELDSKCALLFIPDRNSLDPLIELLSSPEYHPGSHTVELMAQLLECRISILSSSDIHTKPCLLESTIYGKDSRYNHQIYLLQTTQGVFIRMLPRL
jgi:hypothetical protein